jgi:hypothetical protein
MRDRLIARPYTGKHKHRRMASSGMLRDVALVRTDVSEELSASFIRVTRIAELGTTQTLTSNRSTLRRNTKVRRMLATASVGSYKTPRGVTSQKTAFFISSYSPLRKPSNPTFTVN